MADDPTLVRDMRMLYRVLKVYSLGVDREMPLHTLEIFLWAAGHPDCLQEDLIRVTGFTAASVSRSVAWLGPIHRSGRRGLGLIRQYPDHMDQRRKRLTLTPKGLRLVELMACELIDN